MAAAASQGFTAVSSDELEGWPRIDRLINEGCSVEVKIGTKEDNPRFWEAAGAYAREAIEHAEEALRRGVDGVPIPSAP
jgi:hypothetical protein